MGATLKNKCRPIVRVAAVVLPFLGALFLIELFLVLFQRPNLDISVLPKKSAELILKVGGTNKVCDEAARIFKEFGTGKLTIFYGKDLANYPTMAALGADGVWPGNPSYIKVRVGNHFDGYFIDVYDTNNSTKHEKSQGEIEVTSSCIFVHR